MQTDGKQCCHSSDQSTTPTMYLFCTCQTGKAKAEGYPQNTANVKQTHTPCSQRFAKSYSPVQTEDICIEGGLTKLTGAQVGSAPYCQDSMLIVHGPQKVWCVQSLKIKSAETNMLLAHESLI